MCKHKDCPNLAIYKSRQLCRRHYQQLWSQELHTDYINPAAMTIDPEDFWQFVKKELRLK